MDQHWKNEQITVVEMMEVKNGLAVRIQESPEFVKPVGPVITEEVIRANWETIESLSMRLDRMVHTPGSTVEDYRNCNRALYDQVLGSAAHETREKLFNLNTPLLISARNFDLVWELLHDGEDFWGLKYPLARQIRIGLRPPILPSRAYPKRCLIIANPEGEDNLEASEKQAQNLLSHLNTLGIESLYLGRNRATPEQVLIELSSGSYDILHYTGHVVKLNEKNQPVVSDQPGEYAMMLSGGYLRYFEIENATRDIGVVFLNGCQSASSIESLATAFLRKGANLVIGSVFKVSTYGAQVFAQHFYDHALRAEPVGEALRQARMTTLEDPQCGNAWACFVMYGNPCCRLIGATLPAPLQRDYSESARTIVEKCVRFSENAGFVCTPYLFAAMINGDEPLLRNGLQKQGLAPERLQDIFNRALADDAPRGDGAENLEVSPTVLHIIEEAQNMARNDNRNRISENDLLLGFAASGGGAMGRMLAEHGVDLAKMVGRQPVDREKQRDLTADLFNACGDLNDSKMDSSVRKILSSALTCCCRMGWGFIATPHLFLGFCLHGNGLVKGLLEDQGLDVDAVSQAIEEYFAGMRGPSGAEITLNMNCMTQRLRSILFKAESLALESKQHIGEKCLLQALLVCGGGETDRVLRSAGVDIEQMNQRLNRL